MPEKLLNRAEMAVDLATAAGADEAFATATMQRDTEFSVRDGNLEKVKEATSQGLSLKLWVDGRYSSHSTNDLRSEQLQAFITEAVALTRALQPDEDRVITDPSLFAGRPKIDLALYDDGIAALTRDDRLALCEAQNAGLAGQDKVISATSSTSDGASEEGVASSNGFSGTHRSTWLWMGSEVTLQDEGDKRPEGWMWGGASVMDRVPKPEDVAAETMKRARDRLGAVKGPSAKTTMVVHPSASGNLVRRLLQPAIARAAYQGRSFWKDAPGGVSEKLVITDEPLLVAGLASRLYDGEGITATKREIISGGELKTWYVDTYYGKKLGWTPNGGSTSNVVVAPGERGLDELIASAGDGVLVLGWLGGNADPTTGDFSFGTHGFLIEGGQLTSPVSEMNVTGNLKTLFAGLVEVGSDPWPYSSTLSPSMLFEGVDFSGA